jgi:hypothetical protein
MAATLILAAAVIAKIAIAAAMPSMPAGQPPPSDQAVIPATVALVETWPDGRINYELTSARRGSMWTPRFPRIEGYQPPEGAKPVFAVQFARVLVGRDIRVEVSVLLGSAQPPGVPVATVLISPGSRVTVRELTKFGVQPVTLSMAAVAPMTPYLPTAVSVSPLIEIANVELLNAPYPGYRVTLRNLGGQPVSNVAIQSYRGDEKAMSALRRTDDGRPLMQPGDTYTFDMNLTSGGASDDTIPGTWTPRPLDVIEIESVRWADGAHHGTPPFPQIERVVESDSGQRLQLRRIVDALRQTLAEHGSGADLLASAAARIDGLADAEADQLEAAQLAMRGTKAAARADIARFARDQRTPADATAVNKWLTSMLKRYEAWLARLSPP